MLLHLPPLSTTLIPVALGAALVLGGCSGSTTGTAVGPASTAASATPLAPTSSAPTSSAPTSLAPTSAAAPTTSAGTSASSAAGAKALTQAQADAALLTASDIGAGFTEIASDSKPSPLPCTPAEPPLSEQVPSAVKAQRSFTGASGKALVREQILVYADTATATQVLGKAVRGLACGTATIPSNGTSVPVAIKGPEDLLAALGVPADSVQAWEIKIGTVVSILVVGKLGPQLVVDTFTADSSVKTTQLPDAKRIVTDAITKVAAAG